MRKNNVKRKTKETEIICNINLDGTGEAKINTGIGLAYIDTPFNKIGQQISIEIRNKQLGAVIIKPPFIKNNSLQH